MRIATLIACIFTVSGFATDALSAVSFTPSVATQSGNRLPIVRIFGRITVADIQQFNLFVEAAHLNAKSAGIFMADRMPMLVALDSPGGSVSAAIAIGQAIRAANPASVTVQDSASCVSACVLLLAGGVTRSVSGKVGIHRPFIEDDSAFTVAGQKRTYLDIEKSIKAYLTSVNVPPSLYDIMFRIPPEKVRYLTDREMQEFNLNEDDPYYKEARDAEQATKLNLPKSEYQRRYGACSRESGANAAACFNKLHNPMSK